MRENAKLKKEKKERDLEEKKTKGKKGGITDKEVRDK